MEEHEETIMTSNTFLHLKDSFEGVERTLHAEGNEAGRSAIVNCISLTSHTVQQIIFRLKEQKSQQKNPPDELQGWKKNRAATLNGAEEKFAIGVQAGQQVEVDDSCVHYCYKLPEDDNSHQQHFCIFVRL
ncbi:hypothetical protein V9T40_004915 [Parthenolecanium corni]|uniref:Uncharacterized protein n=1 Tax=Parthenolecanium corni TaxID=536013 RepID=A0AAN9Y2I3_9HEMI